MAGANIYCFVWLQVLPTIAIHYRSCRSSHPVDRLLVWFLRYYSKRVPIISADWKTIHHCGANYVDYPFVGVGEQFLDKRSPFKLIANNPVIQWLEGVSKNHWRRFWLVDDSSRQSCIDFTTTSQLQSIYHQRIIRIIFKTLTSLLLWK